jgi:hypothetical protein
MSSPEVAVKEEKSWVHPAYTSLAKAGIPTYTKGKFDYIINSSFPNMPLSAVKEGVDAYFTEFEEGGNEEADEEEGSKDADEEGDDE